MASRTGTSHFFTTTRKYKDQAYRTHLLRRSYREDGKVKNETLGNLSHLPESVIDLIRRSLQGETFVPAGDAFEMASSHAHGHVQAVSLAMQRLGFASLLAAKPSRERELVLAMVASRIVSPATKLATTRLWHASTLAQDFGVSQANEDDLYAAMDWLRAHTRADLLQATEQSLQKIKARVAAGKLVGKDKIGVALGKCVNRYKVAKHVEVAITDDAFTFERLAPSIAAEAAVDGLYVIRTGVKAQRMDAPTCVRTYKSLAQVERAFRSLKSADLKVRPIHHHLQGRVKAHIFLCMLAYYVEWHMREAWRELMFADCDQQAKLERDPVAPAKRSEAAMRKVTSRTPHGGKDAPNFQITTTPTTKQKRAIELIDQIKP